MSYSQAEKMEIIRLVEGSDLSVKRTLAELDVPSGSLLPLVSPLSGEGLPGPGQSATAFKALLEQNPRGRETTGGGDRLGAALRYTLGLERLESAE